MEGYPSKPADMSLDLSKLKMVRDKGDAKVARCPACAEADRDKRGDHLWFGADGRFGCVANPGDRDHARRIWALVGMRANAKTSKRRVRLVIREPKPRTLRTPKIPSLIITLPPIIPRNEKHPSATSVDQPEKVINSQGTQKHPSATSVTALVPRDEPFQDGQRYRLAGESDANRLDLFIADKDGPWLRLHGTLVLFSHPPRS